MEETEFCRKNSVSWHLPKMTFQTDSKGPLSLSKIVPFDVPVFIPDESGLRNLRSLIQTIIMSTPHITYLRLSSIISSLCLLSNSHLLKFRHKGGEGTCPYLATFITSRFMARQVVDMVLVQLADSITDGCELLIYVEGVKQP